MSLPPHTQPPAHTLEQPLIQDDQLERKMDNNNVSVASNGDSNNNTTKVC